MPAREDLTFVDISDFSPGIINPRGYPIAQAAGDLTVAKLGAATIDTKGCVARADGSLGPAFKRTEHFTQAVPGDYNNWGSGYRPTSAPVRWINGTALSAPIFSAFGTPPSDMDQAVVVSMSFEEYIATNNAGAPTSGQPYHHAVHFQRWDKGQAPTTLIANQTRTNAVTNYSTPGVAEFARVQSDLLGGWNLRTSAGTNNIVRSFFWRAATAGVDLLTTPGYDWFTFPDPEAVSGAATVNISSNMTDPFTMAVAAVMHQGRLLLPGPPPPAASISAALQTAEGDSTRIEPIATGISYAPTPYAIDNGTGSAIAYRYLNIMGADDYNITGLLSMNANTLFVTQMHGGCSMIRGDLDRPQITYLPAVPPTGVHFSKPTQSIKGAVYATSTGMYLWNEGNQATPLSPNLPGEFWVPDGTEYDIAFSWQRRGKLTAAGQYLFVPNDYFCDLETGAWWRMASKPDSGTPPFMHYDVSPTQRLMAFPAYLSADTTTMWCEYDLMAQEDAENEVWEWYSHPLPDTLVSRDQVCRQVDVVASGCGTLAVSVGNDGTSETFDLTLDQADNRPRAYRTDASRTTRATPVGAYGGGIQFWMEATGDGTGPLPTVHSIRLGFRSQGSVPRS